MIFFIGYSGAPLLLTSNHAFISSMLHDIGVWLGFSTLHSIAWLFQHPWILFVTAYCYINWNWVAIVVITLINIKGDSLYVERILIILQIAVIACALFAYFFPSVSPIVGLQNQVKQLHGYHEFSRFLSFPYQLQEYYNARHHLSVFINGHFFAGFVAFPSFHTFALLLLLRICWQKFKALFVPILCYSILVLIAILGLAHHYIADLAGALLLFCFSIELEKSLFSKIKKTG